MENSIVIFIISFIILCVLFLPIVVFFRKKDKDINSKKLGRLDRADRFIFGILYIVIGAIMLAIGLYFGYMIYKSWDDLSIIVLFPAIFVVFLLSTGIAFIMDGISSFISLKTK